MYDRRRRPRSTSAEDIPVGGLTVAVADAIDIRSASPEQPPRGAAAVGDESDEEVGSRFDPASPSRQGPP